MTLISFFDEDAIDNVGDLLYFLPERCIFLGPDTVMTKRRRRSLEHFVDSRGLDTEVICKTVPAGDLENAVDVLRELVMDYPDCILDVSGGTELMITAAGIIVGSYDIPVYQRLSHRDKITWQYGCEMEPGKASLTIREAVQLHAGLVFDSDTFPRWNMTEQLRRDVQILWETARKDAGKWNNTCDALAVLARENLEEDPLQVVAMSQSAQEAAMDIDEGIWYDLLKGGFIVDFDGTWQALSFRFRDMEMKRLLTKAGNLLELYVCLAADWASDRDVGVPLDWDGYLGDPGEIETRNELDVMLTVGLAPVCISCKNGQCTKEDLYELETVARRFGGRYVRKILVASYVNHNEKSRLSIKKRAQDMQITLIDRVDEMSMEKLSEKLYKAATGAAERKPS